MQYSILGRRIMSAPPGYARVKTVVAVFSVLWTAACAVMFWSLPNHSALVLFFLIVAAVPIAAALALLMAARRADKLTAPPGPRRRNTAAGKDRSA